MAKKKRQAAKPPAPSFSDEVNAEMAAHGVSNTAELVEYILSEEGRRGKSGALYEVARKLLDTEAHYPLNMVTTGIPHSSQAFFEAGLVLKGLQKQGVEFGFEPDPGMLVAGLKYETIRRFCIANPEDSVCQPPAPALELVFSPPLLTREVEPLKTIKDPEPEPDLVLLPPPLSRAAAPGEAARKGRY